MIKWDIGKTLKHIKLNKNRTIAFNKCFILNNLCGSSYLHLRKLLQVRHINSTSYWEKPAAWVPAANIWAQALQLRSASFTTAFYHHCSLANLFIMWHSYPPLKNIEKYNKGRKSVPSASLRNNTFQYSVYPPPSTGKDVGQHEFSNAAGGQQTGNWWGELVDYRCAFPETHP